MKPNLNSISNKLLLFTAFLFVVFGIINFIVASKSMDSIVNVSHKSEASAQINLSYFKDIISENMQRIKRVEISSIEANNNLVKMEKIVEIEREKALISGRFESALLLISSQTESILAPMDVDDREMFILASDVYVKLLDGTRAMSYFPIFDATSLEDVADFEEFDEGRIANIHEALTKNSGAKNPSISVMPDNGVIRIISLIGPENGRYGVLEVITKDVVSPLNKQLEELEIASSQNLISEKENLDAAIGKVEDSLLVRQTEIDNEHVLRVNDASSTVATAKNLQTITIVISAIAGAALIYFLVVFSITKHITRSISVMKQLAHDNLNVEIPGAGRKDEFGDMADAVTVFQSKLIEMKEISEKQIEDHTKQGEVADLKERLTSEFEIGVSAIINEMEDVVQTTRATSEDMIGKGKSTVEISNAANNVSESSANFVQTAAAAAEELSVSFRQINEQVSNSSIVAGEAVEKAKTSSARMTELSEISGRIGQVIDLIGDIAEQTNLLALNATIEAARAGDAGTRITMA